MINVAEALDIIKEQAFYLGNELLDIDKVNGRIISTDVLADRDFPPFDRVSMDGIAINFQIWKEGNKSYPIEKIIPAGAAQYTIKDKTACVEIMTGAVLPIGLDTVIRYEDLKIEDGIATIELDQIKALQNVHRKGFDKKKGDLVIKRGVELGPAEIGIAATVGKEQLWVKKLPNCLIVSTGDELVDIFETPKPHEIRRSNVYTLQSLLANWHIKADLLHLNDDENEMKLALEAAFEEYDAVLFSGAVSKGKFDFLPQVLEELGVEKLFHRIRQRPGKPFWFGVKHQGPTIFAFPGNPVSSFMCAMVYFGTWLQESLGLPKDQIQAVLAQDIHFKPDLTYFAQVKLIREMNGSILAVSEEGKGSGDLANLANSTGFIQLPRGRNKYEKGDIYSCYPFRSF